MALLSSSWARFLLLVTISMTVMDLSEGIKCYNCNHQKVKSGGGRSSSSARAGDESSCNRRSAATLSVADCQGKCGYMTIEFPDGGNVTQRLCILQRYVKQILGECDDYTATYNTQNPAASKVKRCTCETDECNAPLAADYTENDDPEELQQLTDRKDTHPSPTPNSTASVVSYPCFGGMIALGVAALGPPLAGF